MKKVLVISSLFVILFAFFGCLNLFEDTTTVSVLLTDRPVSDIDKLTVDISSFTYHYAIGDKEGEWAAPTNVATTIDILSLAGTEVSWLNIELPENASLTQLRLTIEEATVTVGGEEYPVEVKNKDVKVIKSALNILSGGELVLDFDLARSLHQKGLSNVYILNPVLKPTFRRGKLYFIKGEVLESGNPLKLSIVALMPTDESTVLRITMTNKYGEFNLGKWKDGEYLIKVYKNVELPDETEDLDLLSLTEDASEVVTVSGEDVFRSINVK
ncbi:hypothetical protein HNP65_001026 [Thermosipho japonicus]|uniref:DUF4382 domain-containing protein n=1 Tax=Thermosipho japonicus TaxID=90323 RepID=A0A841GSI8_9BACT|nr:DUF4382 domain-containing protein [Thermosipho japonicus]MBB6062588.1 hypothetical protein [Thermosipho japonicus]